MSSNHFLEAIRVDEHLKHVKVLNQLLLPSKIEYEEIRTVEEAWCQIREMKVRGAPAIALVGALGLAVELREKTQHSKVITTVSEAKSFLIKSIEHLRTSRPTAVNLENMGDEMQALCTEIINLEDLVHSVEKKATEMLRQDVQDNRMIGEHGSVAILKNIEADNIPVNILTHCNTGSLATGGYGTALGICRALHKKNKLDMVYCTETRPYNQGCRLTAFELVHDKIPGTLICDSMASLVMKNKGISAVVIGADRVVSNGDTANKIGSYQLAICAKYHNIPFYVAAPTTSIDFNVDDGKDIVIEERCSEEMCTINGIRIAAEGINVYNPAFDVVPAKLITGIVTELGVFEASNLNKLKTLWQESHKPRKRKKSLVSLVSSIVS